MQKIIAVQVALCAAIVMAIMPVVSAAEPSLMTIPVDSSAFMFSPGNWTGDDGRGGKVFRQTWNPGAYFRVAWETSNPQPTAKIIVDTKLCPSVAYNIDGVWKSRLTSTSEIIINNIKGAGKHELSVYVHGSVQKSRWGGNGQSGLNVFRITGLQVDADSKPIITQPAAKWALIVGDSITEGCGASELTAYSHLVGQALQTQGYEYCISACGWSGWINKGDNPPGDVPGYYYISQSVNGVGGKYDDSLSRWNKIDGNNHSLLDATGQISAHGKTGQQPALIMINYGTNDQLHKSNPSDTMASIVQSLAALRQSAPAAQIVILIPFGQYYARELKAAVAIHQKANPADSKVAVIDLGPEIARTLAANSLLGGLHPNDRGHAIFAAKIIPQLLMILNHGAK